MADISKIILPSGNSYNFKDATARSDLSKLAVATTATIATSAWSNLSATVNISGVTASNNVIVSPDPTSREVALKAQMYCSAQGSGTLTFTCKTVPTANVVVNVLMFG